MKRLFSGSSDHGFTLVELVLTVVILGIIAVIALPRFFNPEAFQERSYFDRVAAAFRYAQKYAVATGCEVQVRVAGDSSFGLYQGAGGCNVAPFTLAVPHPTQTGPFTGSAPGGVAISPAPSTVTFDAEGRASPGTSFTVGGHSFTVVAGTGFVNTP